MTAKAEPGPENRATGELPEGEHSRTTFLAALAHELRNPLAPICNAVQILHLKSPPNPEVQWALDVIDRQMQHISRLIDNLSDVTRTMSDKPTLRKKRLDLATVLQSSVARSRSYIKACGQQLVFTLPAQPIYLEADPDRLTAIVCALLDNAAKFSPQGGHIWLSAEREGTTAVISVQDNGAGLSAELLPRIFDLPAAAADDSMERSPDVMKFGLRDARRMVEMHGGKLVARSDGPGKGSEFSVRLPMLSEQLHVAPQSELPPDDAMPPFMLRILVVDDNRDAVSSMEMLLRAMGNEVRTAHDGFEALRVAEDFWPNVILLDIGLPKMSGYNVAEKIRQQPWGKLAVIVAVTGWGRESDKLRAKEAGFDRHLVKPADPSAIIELLASMKPQL